MLETRRETSLGISTNLCEINGGKRSPSSGALRDLLDIGTLPFQKVRWKVGTWVAEDGSEQSQWEAHPACMQEPGVFWGWSKKRCIIRFETKSKNQVLGTGVPGYGGDGGPAAAAQIAFIGGIAVDAGGGLLIADSGNGRVRRVDVGGAIATVAGTGVGGFAGDGGPGTCTCKPVQPSQPPESLERVQLAELPA
eukprot:gene17120-biopygen7210